MKMKEKITNLNEDNRGVSPVIGVIMMIAIVVIIAAVVAAFAYGIIGGVNKAPSTAMVVEGVHAGNNVTVSLFHHGGDTITEAFHNESSVTTIEGVWDNVEIRKNGAALADDNSNTFLLNDYPLANVSTWDPNFASGDMLKVNINALVSGDSIVILHTPSDSILQRVTVM